LRFDTSAVGVIVTTMTGAIRARTELVRARNVVFAAPRDDPRARRPADAAVLVLATIVVAAAAVVHRVNSDLDARVLRLFDGGLPGWITATLTIAFLLGGLFALGLLLGVALLGHGRGAVVRDMVAAGALAAVAATVLAGITGPEWPDILPEWFERNGFPSYPVLDLSIAVAIVGVANPYLSLPMRHVGGRLLGLMAIAAVVMRYGTLSGVVGAFALGSAAAAAIHLIFGSGVGIPSKARIRAALATSGIDTASVEYLHRQPVGATLVNAELVDGSHTLVKIYGRDAAEAAFASRLWRALWYRGNSPALTTSGLQLVEHESLMLLAGERAHAPVPALVGWGRGESGDAVVATEWLDAPRLIELQPEQVDDAQLDAIWEALAQLHRARIAHCALDGRRIVVRGDTVILDDFEAARISPDDSARAADRAQLLAATAVIVGRERAVAAAHRNVDHDDLMATLPVLQRAAMSRALERDIHAAHLKLKDLRDDVATALGTKAPQLAELKRVSWAHVALVALSAFAAYTLITQLAEIGFDTIAEQMRGADWSWIVIAFVLAQMTNVGEYVTLTGMVARPVPFAPTIMFRYAIAFIDLAVPGDAGAIAMNVRYMQRLGVSAAGAVAQGPLLVIVSKVTDVVLLALSARYVGAAVELDELESGPIFRLLVWVVVAVVIGAIVMFTVPKLRNRVVPPVKEGLSAIKESVTDPRRLVRIIGGTLMQKILFAAALSASVTAYGGTLSFGQAVSVNVTVSLLVGLIPVPGGVGVGEAALTAGLTTVGVPAEVAAAAAITHRMVTSYIPPVFGFFASRWLTEHEYL
jgi:uncharacterized membrane protein YbhN (UPF0104 family)